MYIQRRFRSVCAFSQPDENLPWAHFGWPRIQNFFMWTRKTQIILHGRAGWSESSLVARQMVRFLTLRFLCPGFRHSNSFLLSLGIRSRRQYPTLTLPERLIICFIIILLLFVYLQADQLTEEQIAGTCLINNSITIFSYYFPGKHILWYSIEAPRWRASSEYPQHISRNKKILKAPYSSKIDIFIQERFNKLIYGMNTIIKCGTWQPVKFQLVSRSWLDQKWNDFLSYPWIISFHFIFMNERLTEIFPAVRCHIFWLY